MMVVVGGGGAAAAGSGHQSFQPGGALNEI